MGGILEISCHSNSWLPRLLTKVRLFLTSGASVSKWKLTGKLVIIIPYAYVPLQRDVEISGAG